MAYVALTVEGGLFPSDLLDRVATGQVEGQGAADFRLPGGRLSDEIQSAFSDLRSFWDAFQRRLPHSRESLTTLTRDAWVRPLLERLGFDLVYQRAAAQVGGESYAISHRAGDEAEAPPVHIVALDQPLDRRAGGARRSPHALVQEYLNRADALWGIATNGERLRLLRDSARLARPTYLEFDLRALVEGNLYSEFVLLYRLLHRSRFPRGAADAHECWLERYYQQGIEEGGRVRERLREGVQAALEELGSAFLAHRDSERLRQALRSGALDAAGYYRQLLRLVYRLLFLMVVEERRLVFPPGAGGRQEVYTRYYSVGRLRDRCERYFAEDRHSDLWQGLLRSFRLFREEEARLLGLAALDGELFGPFACPDLEGAGCENAALLGAISHLSTFSDEGGRRRRGGGAVRRRVNYAALDVEELGSVYESLLEYRPRVVLEREPRFELVRGSERKQTGSYYTPPELVRELVNSALVPVVEARLAEASTRAEKERALLGITVCDPACGSGHFLLAAARRLGRELARLRSGEEEPPPEAYRLAVRDVVRRCLYGVDRNPLAVDLCKVALWLEGHHAGLPLTFLDHHVKCGDSLVGVADLKVLVEGIPDGAYAPVTGDDRQAAAYYRKRNARERGARVQWSLAAAPGGIVASQTSLDALLAVPGTSPVPERLAEEFGLLAALDERTPRDVRAKEELYESLRRRGSDWRRLKLACDLWTAAFFTPLQQAAYEGQDLVPTSEVVRRYLAQPGAAYGPLVARAEALAQGHPFFHWPLEFPEVFQRGGFDVVLGNPPWEMLQLDPEEFFAQLAPDIANAGNMAKRKRLIDQLPETNAELAEVYAAAKRTVDCTQKFVHESGRFPLTSYGRINLAPLFAELARLLVNASGRAGLLVPTGIATDSFNQRFFRTLADRGNLVSLLDFENRGIFPDVHRSYKFCLLTLAGGTVPRGEFAFFLTGVDQLRDPRRRFPLSAEDFALLNPNTRTCPVFRTRADPELTRAIYRRVPVLVNEQTGSNPWGFSGLLMFMMNTDSHLFHDQPGPGRVPLYEAKLLHQFDHRFASYQPDGTTRELTAAEKADPACRVRPRYWVDAREVEARLAGRWDRGWLLGWRDICRSTDERTVISSVFPRAGCGDTFLLMLPAADYLTLAPLLLACLNSLTLDYAARQKVGGTHLKFHVFRQLPVLPPSVYREDDVAFIVPRVLELVYTAWDLQPFARDLGYDGPPFRWDEERRALLRAELDAYYAMLYGLSRDELRYILDPADVYGPDFPGETFRVLKQNELKRYGEYRTRRLVLEAWERLDLTPRPPSLQGRGARKGRGSERTSVPGGARVAEERIVTGQRVAPERLERAKALRRAMTQAERVLWEQLRQNRLRGLHFRRQQIIAGFIVDFYCHAARLVVEVDGGVHQEQGEYDTARDGVLESRGLRVLRLTNEEVRRDLAGVLRRIAAAAESGPPPPPSLQSESQLPPPSLKGRGLGVRSTPPSLQGRGLGG